MGTLLDRTHIGMFDENNAKGNIAMQKVFVVLFYLVLLLAQTRKVSRDSGDAKVETRVNTSGGMGMLLKARATRVWF